MLLEVVQGLATGGTAVLYTTHYLPELEKLEATVAILEEGRIIARGTQDSLIAQHGGALLELVFDGPAPALPELQGATSSGSSVRVPARDPARAAGDVLGRLGVHSRRLRSVEIVRPGLEAAYLALTGRRDVDGASGEVERDAA